jgi:TRAP-type C4-dicarboxylate transport system permease small subunit
LTLARSIATLREIGRRAGRRLIPAHDGPGERLENVEAGDDGDGGMTAMARRLMAALGALMAVVVVAMMLLTVVDVVGRYVFNHPIPGSSEIIEYLLAILVFGTLPIATWREEHIVVDILDFMFKGRAKQIQQIVVHLVGGLSLGFVGWRLVRQALQYRGFGDVSQFLKLPYEPLAWFMALLSFVSAFMALALFAAALRSELPSRRAGPSAATQQAAG